MTIKFFLNPFYLTDNYCPEAIQLAYGFKQIGHRVIANINYWEHEGGYLLEESNTEDYDFAIMDHRFVYHTKPWVIKHHIDGGDLKKVPRVLLERQCGQEWSPQWNRDGWLGFFDLVCATDRTIHHPRHEKIVPWTIGVIPEIADTIKSKSSPSFVTDRILKNFRVAHDVRGMVVESLNSEDRQPTTRQLIEVFDEQKSADVLQESLHHATGGRFQPEYFKRINAYSLFLTCGGYIQPKPFVYEHFDADGNSSMSMAVRLRKKWNRHRRDWFNLGGSNKANVVIQWDSFRWWESLVADCAPLMLDFDYWGLELPVKPTEGVHYVGIRDLQDPSLLQRINDYSLNDLEAIGQAGRKWFDEQYSPSSQARRLLQELEARVGNIVPNDRP